MSNGSTDSKQLDEVPLMVLSNHHELANVRSVVLDNSQGLIPVHLAGQHLKLGVETNSGLVWKSFSISSSPTLTHSFEVTVRLKPNGVVSRATHDLKRGDIVIVKGPSGRFFYDPDQHIEPLCFLAAGIGLTPIMSMLRLMLARNEVGRAMLIYGVQSRHEVLFARELRYLAKFHEGFRFIPCFSQVDKPLRGRITPEFLAEQTLPLADGRFFLSGPGDFNATIHSWLIANGAQPDRIHTEVFGKVR